MAKMPGVVWDPLPENRTEPYINPSQIIIHTAVDGNVNIPDYFRRRDVYVESHFWITRNGRITQMLDTHRQADANYRANNSAISIETEDDGDPEGIPWTNAQIESLVRVIKWASATHGIPIRRCRSSTAPGVGWHSMWSYPTDPINLRGRPVRSPWTTALGKTCPGRTRIRQLVETVLPRAAGEVVDPGDPDPEGRDTIHEGSRGGDVKEMQDHLKLPSDGVFGPNTEAAVKTFQMAQGLTVDGIAGPKTWSRVDNSESSFAKKTSQYLPYTLWMRSPYSYRSQYQALTRVLNSELLLPASPVFSSRTDAATRGFQRGAELTVDGMVGRQTWGTLFFGDPNG